MRRSQLSNWYESKFIVDHVKFSSMEQFMVYEGLIAKFSQNEELKAIKEHPEADKEEIYKMLKQKNKICEFSTNQKL